MPLPGGTYVDGGLRIFCKPTTSSKLLEPSRVVDVDWLLLAAGLCVTVSTTAFEDQATIGRSVGRQAPTMPAQISTPLHMAAGASASVLHQLVIRDCPPEQVLRTAGILVCEFHVWDTPDADGADAGEDALAVALEVKSQRRLTSYLLERSPSIPTSYSEVGAVSTAKASGESG